MLNLYTCCIILLLTLHCAYFNWHSAGNLSAFEEESDMAILDQFERFASKIGSFASGNVRQSSTSRRRLLLSIAGVAAGSAAVSQATPASAATCYDRVVVIARAGDGANLRTCASTACSVYTSVSCGTQLINAGNWVSGGGATGCFYSTEWWKVQLPGGSPTLYAHASVIQCGSYTCC